MRCWSTITRLGGGALALALLTGCAGDATVTDPAIALPTLSRDSLRPSFTIAPPLEITPANEQRCESRTVERDPGGRFVRWRASQREQVAVARAAADTVLTRYEAYAFDRTGAQTAEAQCILRRGTNAKQFMRGFFERPGRGGLVGVLAEATAAPVPPGVPPVFIGVGTVCLFDVWSWQMQCGNTTCYPMFAARAPTGAVRFGLAEDTATRVGGPTARLIGGWECPGVGHLSLNGNGTLTLHPNGGGGGGSGGGGGCGGGGGGSGGDSSGDGSVNPPGGGGGATSWWGASCDTVVLDSLPSPEEENALLCSLLDAEFASLSSELGYASVEETDPFLLIDVVLIAWDVFDWAQEGYTCEGARRVAASALGALPPGPNVGGLAARGARVPKIAAALREGRRQHRSFAEERRAAGEFAELTIEGVSNNVSGRGRVDAVKIDPATRTVIVRELKPLNSRAFEAGGEQLARYIQAMRTDGRVVGRPDLDFRALAEQGYTFVGQVHTYNPFP
mgnify:CR=1 FL=1